MDQRRAAGLGQVREPDVGRDTLFELDVALSQVPYVEEVGTGAQECYQQLVLGKGNWVCCTSRIQRSSDTTGLLKLDAHLSWSRPWDLQFHGRGLAGQSRALHVTAAKAHLMLRIAADRNASLTLKLVHGMGSNIEFHGLIWTVVVFGDGYFGLRPTEKVFRFAPCVLHQP
jgi:hypothetical protein